MDVSGTDEEGRHPVLATVLMGLLRALDGETPVTPGPGAGSSPEQEGEEEGRCDHCVNQGPRHRRALTSELDAGKASLEGICDDVSLRSDDRAVATKPPRLAPISPLLHSIEETEEEGEEEAGKYDEPPLQTTPSSGDGGYVYGVQTGERDGLGEVRARENQPIGPEEDRSGPWTGTSKACSSTSSPLVTSEDSDVASFLSKKEYAALFSGSRHPSATDKILIPSRFVDDYGGRIDDALAKIPEVSRENVPLAPDPEYLRLSSKRKRYSPEDDLDPSVNDESISQSQAVQPSSSVKYADDFRDAKQLDERIDLEKDDFVGHVYDAYVVKSRKRLKTLDEESDLSAGEMSVSLSSDDQSDATIEESHGSSPFDKTRSVTDGRKKKKLTKTLRSAKNYPPDFIGVSDSSDGMVESVHKRDAIRSKPVTTRKLQSVLRNAICGSMESGEGITGINYQHSTRSTGASSSPNDPLSFQLGVPNTSTPDLKQSKNTQPTARETPSTSQEAAAFESGQDSRRTESIPSEQREEQSPRISSVGTESTGSFKSSSPLPMFKASESSEESNSSRMRANLQARISSGRPSSSAQSDLSTYTKNGNSSSNASTRSRQEGSDNSQDFPRRFKQSSDVEGSSLATTSLSTDVTTPAQSSNLLGHATSSVRSRIDADEEGGRSPSSTNLSEVSTSYHSSVSMESTHISQLPGSSASSLSKKLRLKSFGYEEKSHSPSNTSNLSEDVSKSHFSSVTTESSPASQIPESTARRYYSSSSTFKSRLEASDEKNVSSPGSTSDLSESLTGSSATSLGEKLRLKSLGYEEKSYSPSNASNLSEDVGKSQFSSITTESSAASQIPESTARRYYSSSSTYKSRLEVSDKKDVPSPASSSNISEEGTSHNSSVSTESSRASPTYKSNPALGADGMFDATSRSMSIDAQSSISRSDPKSRRDATDGSMMSSFSQTYSETKAASYLLSSSDNLESKEGSGQKSILNEMDLTAALMRDEFMVIEDDDDSTLSSSDTSRDSLEKQIADYADGGDLYPERHGTSDGYHGADQDGRVYGFKNDVGHPAEEVAGENNIASDTLKHRDVQGLFEKKTEVIIQEEGKFHGSTKSRYLRNDNARNADAILMRTSHNLVRDVLVKSIALMLGEKIMSRAVTVVQVEDTFSIRMEKALFPTLYDDHIGQYNLQSVPRYESNTSQSTQENEYDGPKHYAQDFIEHMEAAFFPRLNRSNFSLGPHDDIYVKRETPKTPSTFGRSQRDQNDSGSENSTCASSVESSDTDEINAQHEEVSLTPRQIFTLYFPWIVEVSIKVIFVLLGTLLFVWNEFGSFVDDLCGCIEEICRALQANTREMYDRGTQYEISQHGSGTANQQHVVAAKVVASTETEAILEKQFTTKPPATEHPIPKESPTDKVNQSLTEALMGDKRSTIACDIVRKVVKSAISEAEREDLSSAASDIVEKAIMNACAIGRESAKASEGSDTDSISACSLSDITLSSISFMRKQLAEMRDIMSSLKQDQWDQSKMEDVTSLQESCSSQLSKSSLSAHDVLPHEALTSDAVGLHSDQNEPENHPVEINAANESSKQDQGVNAANESSKQDQGVNAANESSKQDHDSQQPNTSNITTTDDSEGVGKNDPTMTTHRSDDSSQEDARLSLAEQEEEQTDGECDLKSSSSSALSLTDMPFSSIAYIREQLASVKTLATSIMEDCSAFAEERAIVSRRSSSLTFRASTSGHQMTASEETLGKNSSKSSANLVGQTDLASDGGQSDKLSTGSSNHVESRIAKVERSTEGNENCNAKHKETLEDAGEVTTRQDQGMSSHGVEESSDPDLVINEPKCVSQTHIAETHHTQEAFEIVSDVDQDAGSTDTLAKSQSDVQMKYSKYSQQPSISSSSSATEQIIVESENTGKGKTAVSCRISNKGIWVNTAYMNATDDGSTSSDVGGQTEEHRDVRKKISLNVEISPGKRRKCRVQHSAISTDTGSKLKLRRRKRDHADASKEEKIDKLQGRHGGCSELLHTKEVRSQGPAEVVGLRVSDTSHSEVNTATIDDKCTKDGASNTTNILLDPLGTTGGMWVAESANLTSRTPRESDVHPSPHLSKTSVERCNEPLNDLITSKESLVAEERSCVEINRKSEQKFEYASRQIQSTRDCVSDESLLSVRNKMRRYSSTRPVRSTQITNQREPSEPLHRGKSDTLKFSSLPAKTNHEDDLLAAPVVSRSERTRAVLSMMDDVADNLSLGTSIEQSDMTSSTSPVPSRSERTRAVRSMMDDIANTLSLETPIADNKKTALTSRYMIFRKIFSTKAHQRSITVTADNSDASLAASGTESVDSSVESPKTPASRSKTSLGHFMLSISGKKKKKRSSSSTSTHEATSDSSVARSSIDSNDSCLESPRTPELQSTSNIMKKLFQGLSNKKKKRRTSRKNKDERSAFDEMLNDISGDCFIDDAFPELVSVIDENEFRDADTSLNDFLNDVVEEWSYDGLQEALDSSPGTLGERIRGTLRSVLNNMKM